MAVSYTFYKNDGTSVSEQFPHMPATPFPDPAADFGWSVQGKTFKGWNTESDGSGTFYYTGDTIFTGTTFYAIWEAPVIKYLTTDRDLTSVANAIRAKSGGSASLAFPTGFVSEIQAIPSGGSITIDDMCDRTWITGAQTIQTATTVDPYAFAETGLTKISSSTVTTILDHAFYGCSDLEEASFPELTSIRVSAGSTSFATTNTFGLCAKLEKFYAPKLEYIYANYVFARVGSIYACTADCVFVFPAIKELGEYTFETCPATLFDFGPGLTRIRRDVFFGRVAATQRNKTLILRRTGSVVVAQTADTIREVTDVYCPSALISSYQTATNWKTRYDGGYITFHAIEGSQYATAYADGTPIT